MRKLAMLAAGMLVSLLGSAFTGLALSVWVFQETGSATQYGITLVMSFLPGILFAPAAGALVDRWNRRAILIVSDSLNVLNILALVLLSMAGVLEPWHVFIAIGIQSLVRALTVPALNSVVVLLAPREQVGRANGIVIVAQAVGNTVGYALGGVLLLTIGLHWVLLVDSATFAVNVAILLFVSIPRPPRSAAGSVDEGNLLSEIRQGWRYLAARRVLVSLVLFYAALNLCVGYADVLLTPVVLSLASALALGLVVAFMGVGMALGGITLAVWGGPRRRIHGLAGCALPLGLFLVLGALRPSVVLIMIAAFGVFFCFTIIDGTTRSVLQLEVEPDMQGRVFSTFAMVANATLCLSYALAGPVADNYFEPLLRDGGPLTGTVGTVMGVGQGRGMALLVLLLGVLVVAVAVVAYLLPSMRSVPDRPTGGDADEAEPAPTIMDLPAERAGASAK